MGCSSRAKRASNVEVVEVLDVCGLGMALETSPPNPLSIDGDGETRMRRYSWMGVSCHP
jgi:hypothetical protein